MDNIFYLTNDPERASGLEHLLQNFHIVCIDDTHLGRSISKKTDKLFCLESQRGETNPIFRSSYRLLQTEEAQKYIQDHSRGAPYLITFKISEQFEQLASKLGYEVLNTTSELNQRYENKISQYDFLKGLRIDIPKSVVGKLTDYEYRQLSDSLGEKYVIQFDKGHTGQGTVFISNSDEFEEIKAKFPSRIAKISEFIQGDAWTLNCVVTDLGVHYGGLSYQITGESLLTSREGATVGNDWTKTDMLNEEQIAKIKQITQKVGEGMYQGGFKGLFGLDLIVQNERVTLIEINARQPASTGIHTKYMIEQRQIPLILLHIAQFIGKDKKGMVQYLSNVYKEQLSEDILTERLKDQNEKLAEPIELSQFLIRDTNDDPASLRRAMPQGRYFPNLFLDDQAHEIFSLKQNDQFLLTSADPERIITPGSEVARVQLRGSCIKGNNRIDKRFHWLIRMVNENLKELDEFTLPAWVLEMIDDYRFLQVDSQKVRVPYYRNVKRVRAGLRSLLGKGTPEEIEEDTLIYSKLRDFPLTNNSEKNIREFMQSEGIGVDCSGFVAQILDYWLKTSGTRGLGAKIKFPQASIARSIIRRFRLIENISANILTNDANSDLIDLSEVTPGDLIRLPGNKRGDHILLVHTVKKSSEGNPIWFKYVHSSPHYGDENGVKYGEVEITDLHKTLSEQKWLEMDLVNGLNWTYDGYKREDMAGKGLRRLKFHEYLKW